MKYSVLGMILIPVATSAAWMADQQGGAFDGNPMNLALTENGGKAFGLRCNKEGLQEVAYIIDEQVDDDSLSNINVIGTEILIKVDDNDPYELSSVAFSNGDVLMLTSEAGKDLINEILAAKSGISAATRLAGQLFYEQKFDVVGSTKAVNEIVEKCGVKLD